MTMTAFLKENPNPTLEEIREGIDGNLCRCTGYQNIIDSVKLAAEQMAAARKEVTERNSPWKRNFLDKE